MGLTMMLILVRLADLPTDRQKIAIAPIKRQTAISPVGIGLCSMDTKLPTADARKGQSVVCAGQDWWGRTEASQINNLECPPFI